MAVAFEGLTRTYGRTTALDAISLAVEEGGFTVFCGAPQSGKSTLFRCLIGLERPDAGRIILNGEDVTEWPAATRPVGYVPQSFALYPNLTVAQNIAYPMRLAGAPRRAIEAQVEKAATTLSITHLLRKTPDQLSGGEKQRVAVARGLSKDAHTFVLDDPLVGLDYKLRERLMDDLKALRAELGATFLYATSDSLEALTMADRLVVLDAGRIVAEGPVEEVYDRPAHWRAMELVGFPRANIFRGEVANGVVTAGPVRLRTSVEGARPVIAGIRPEAVRINGGGEPATVTLVEDLGGERVVYLDAGGHELRTAAPVEGENPTEGDRVAFSLDDVLLFDPDGRPLGHAAGTA
jgi:multiple sugar transport system ATP-binding protein